MSRSCVASVPPSRAAQGLTGRSRRGPVPRLQGPGAPQRPTRIQACGATRMRHGFAHRSRSRERERAGLAGAAPGAPSAARTPPAERCVPAPSARACNGLRPLAPPFAFAQTATRTVPATGTNGSANENAGATRLVQGRGAAARPQRERQSARPRARTMSGSQAELRSRGRGQSGDHLLASASMSATAPRWRAGRWPP